MNKKWFVNNFLTFKFFSSLKSHLFLKRVLIKNDFRKKCISHIVWVQNQLGCHSLPFACFSISSSVLFMYTINDEGPTGNHFFFIFSLSLVSLYVLVLFLFSCRFPLHSRLSLCLSLVLCRVWPILLFVLLLASSSTGCSALVAGLPGP